MKAILVMDVERKKDLRVMVELNHKTLAQKVLFLLQADRTKEAFDILKNQGEVLAYLPKGKKSLPKVEVTLFEDLL